MNTDILEHQLYKNQLEFWLKGLNYHIDHKAGSLIIDPPSKDMTCVPDFSCCVEGVKTQQYEKVRFIKAFAEQDEETMNEMLMMFLQKCVPDVHVVSVMDYNFEVDSE